MTGLSLIKLKKREAAPTVIARNEAIQYSDYFRLTFYLFTITFYFSSGLPREPCSLAMTKKYTKFQFDVPYGWLSGLVIKKLGCGDSPLTVPFYEKCGFKRSHVVKDFFTENYDHPIYECGIQLVDMIYFTKELR